MPIISSSSSSASEFHGFIKSNSQTEGEINEMAGNYQTAPKKETKLEWIRGRLESWITWYRTWRNPPEVKSNKRTVHINDHVSNHKFKFAKNVIKTSKYNIATFLPINLFEQFKRSANIYFLALLIIQLLPINLSPISPVTTIIPLVVVLSVTAIKDGCDDVRRHKCDNVINNRVVNVVQGDELQEKRWKNVEVGDIVKLQDDDFVPADMVILSSSESHAACYVETAELDGETNLKMKQGLTYVESYSKPFQFSKFEGKIVCDKPNSHMTDFGGEIFIKINENFEEEQFVLTNNNLLLRGCRMRNTPWVYGIVIFAGKETKLVQNSGNVTFKRTHLDKLLNVLVLTIFVFLFILCLITSVGSSMWEYYVGKDSRVYLPLQTIMGTPYDLTPSANLGLALVAYFILLNTVVPISLYVTVEVIRLGLSFYIDYDQKMWYKSPDHGPSEKPRKAKARTTTLNEELGQVKYIFSDKTGTLTQNKMVFNMCSIDGSLFGQKEDTNQAEFQKVEYRDDESMANTSYLANSKTTGSSSKKSFFLPLHKYQAPMDKTDFRWHDRSLIKKIDDKDPKVSEFFTALALCHTVLPEGKQDEQGFLIPESLQYQAQSPDEAALLSAARGFGYTFKARTPEEIEVAVGDDIVYFQLLAFIDFDNDRKRMSVVVRGPYSENESRDKMNKDKKPIVLYCKGADNLLFERLATGQNFLKDITENHLEIFACEGLRTLVVSKKEFKPRVFNDWYLRYEEASKDPVNNRSLLHDLEEELEAGMTLLGATAIEDKLQDKVADTIQAIHQAQIKLWVLTGDKLETAMNIGFSCKMLLSEDEMEVTIIDSKDANKITEDLLEVERKLRKIESKQNEPEEKKDDSTTQTGRISIGDLRTRPEGPSSSESSASTPKLHALVITGDTLHAVENYSRKASTLDTDAVTLKDLFLLVGCKCHTVICSRVTPGQKALVVDWVKTKENAITLAIGDGANDVSMIKKAHIGIGVEGQEGMQAVLSSDYSIAQFHYLKRLLLLHGHWSYHRMSFFLRYFFYKNFAFSLMQFWFAMYCGFSAQSVYDNIFIICYNMLYTAMPVIGIGLFDKDVGSKYCLTFPQIYCSGQEDKLFNKFVFFQSVLHGTWHSIVIFFITVGLYSNYSDSGGFDYSDYRSFVAANESNLMLVVSLQAILDTKNWTCINHLCIWGSVLAFYICQTIASLPQLSGTWITDVFDTSSSLAKVLGTANYWFTALLSCSLCILPVLALRTVEVDLRPSYIDLMRIISKKKRSVVKQIERSTIASPRPVSRRKSSAYAFSHSEGFGRMIQRGEYLQDPNEFKSSRVLTGGRSLSRRLLPVPQEDLTESEATSVRRSINSTNPSHSILHSEGESGKATGSSESSKKDNPLGGEIQPTSSANEVTRAEVNNDRQKRKTRRKQSALEEQETDEET